MARDASVIIRAPMRMPFGYIESFVSKKRSWIDEKQRVARERLKHAVPKKFVEGEEFLYLGQTYSLAIVDDADTPLSFDLSFRLSRFFASDARRLFIEWYRREAHTRIRERLDRHSALANLSYTGFKLTNAQRCWGSCTAKGSLNFSWRLIMAPTDVIDYVVVHEISHLAEKNHSRRFWNTVSELFPGYEKHRDWLKANGHLLTI